MAETSYTPLGKLLQQTTRNIAQYDQFQEQLAKQPALHVPSVANSILQAYEQLRNASENIEDHLLLQRAIIRFYKRTVSLHSKSKPGKQAEELVIELTQAAYLQNDIVMPETIDSIDKLIQNAYSCYQKVTTSGVPTGTAERWILEVLSIKTEQLLNNPIRILSFVHFTHVYFANHIDYDRLTDTNESVNPNDYPTLLYIGIHRALLRSDDANIRSNLLDLYKINFSHTKRFIDLNTTYDTLANLKSTTRITRFITKNGAPLRIIKATYFDSKEQFTNKTTLVQTENTIGSYIDDAYTDVQASIAKGVLKSIIFLLITKALIGLIVEIPYDLIVEKAIVWLPLLINLLFPPVFIALSSLTLQVPGSRNKEALINHISSMLHANTDMQQVPAMRYSKSTSGMTAFNIFYTITLIAAFLTVGLLLAQLGFNIVQGVIFVIFLSTASFLSYRLSVQVKELELVTKSQGFFSLLSDFIYAPFIFIGQRISYRFGQLNIIAQILDLAVDLPLKTFVRLIRQWMNFLNNKKDELL